MQIATAVAAESPIVFMRGADVFANSRTVANHFNKQHGHVIRDIERLIGEGVSNFGETPFVDPQNGQTYRSFDMDRRGFTILTLGFSGKKALVWKLRFMDAFEAMEEELRRQASPAPMVPQTLSEALRLAADLADQNERQKQLLDVVQPKALALDRIAEARGSLCITDAAKTLRMQPKELFAWMRANRWIFKRPGTTTDRAFETVRQAGYLRHELSAPDARGWTFDQVRVTPKGMAYLSNIFNQTRLLNSEGA